MANKPVSFRLRGPELSAIQRLSDVTRVPQSALLRAALTLLFAQAVEHGFLLTDAESALMDIGDLPLCLRHGRIDPEQQVDYEGRKRPLAAVGG